MRYREIDIFKGILTALMVMCHCMQFFIDLQPGTWQHGVSEYINLTTFSGFLFAFGFAAWHAYINKPYPAIFPKVLKNAVRMLVAYYLSAFGFRIFVEKMPLNTKRMLDILRFDSLAGWSEFLLSFAALMVLILCLQPLMRRAGRYLAPGIAVVAIAACVAPVPVTNAVVAIFLGQADFAVFAVVPYCLYFALGVLIAQSGGKIPRYVAAVCAAGTVAYYAVLFGSGAPSRFPLSWPWLVGALGLVCAYYYLSVYLAAFKWTELLENIGKNSLFYLLMSNLFIFAVKSSKFFKLDTGYAFAAFIVIMLAIYYLQGLIAGRAKPRAQAN